MIPTWYVPSFYGDVRLTRLEKKLTRVSWEKLTAAERGALDALAKKADRSWNPRGAVALPETKASRPDGLFAPDRGSVLLDASLDNVRKVVARAMGRGRDTVDVVKFEDGHIIELVETERPEEAKSVAGDVPTPLFSGSEESKAKAGVTVKRPVLGCPEPRLPNAEIRAREVLGVFLSGEQMADFVRHNSFVSSGAGTGHRYMVTSRHARGRLAQFRRQLYDLDEGRAYCVHDYSVPAAEEILCLHLFLQLPWGERYLRHLD